MNLEELYKLKASLETPEEKRKYILVSSLSQFHHNDERPFLGVGAPREELHDAIDTDSALKEIESLLEEELRSKLEQERKFDKIERRLELGLLVDEKACNAEKTRNGPGISLLDVLDEDVVGLTYTHDETPKQDDIPKTWFGKKEKEEVKSSPRYLVRLSEFMSKLEGLGYDCKLLATNYQDITSYEKLVSAALDRGLSNVWLGLEITADFRKVQKPRTVNESKSKSLFGEEKSELFFGYTPYVFAGQNQRIRSILKTVSDYTMEMLIKHVTNEKAITYISEALSNGNESLQIDLTYYLDTKYREKTEDENTEYSPTDFAHNILGITIHTSTLKTGHGTKTFVVDWASFLSRLKDLGYQVIFDSIEDPSFDSLISIIVQNGFEASPAAVVKIKQKQMSMAPKNKDKRQ